MRKTNGNPYSDKDLYRSYKNENNLIWVLVLSFLLLFLGTGGILLDIAMWIWFIIDCNNNNQQLDNNPDIQRKRVADQMLTADYLERQRKKK